MLLTLDAAAIAGGDWGCAVKRAATAAPPNCRFCTKPIDGERIATCAGPMHPHCYDEHKRKVAESYERGVAEGTNSRISQHVCGLCGQLFTGGIYHTTLDGKECCKPCARRIDQVSCMLCRKPIRDEAEEFYSSRYGLVHKACIRPPTSIPEPGETAQRATHAHC